MIYYIIYKFNLYNLLCIQLQNQSYIPLSSFFYYFINTYCKLSLNSDSENFIDYL